MSAKELLQDYMQLAEPRLAEFLDRKGKQLAGLPVDLQPLHAALRDYVLRGGKRMRGTLVLLGHEAGGGARESAVPASLGVELLHAYLLIHDDFMDRDELRRGGPTLHSTFAKSAGAHGGASLAILFGSLCQAWAYELVLQSPVLPSRVLQATQLLTSALQDVTIGQALDVAAPLGPELTAAGVLELERLKTGSYSFELPLLLGARLAGASEALQAILSSYARPLGQAFQIADDLLGTFAAPEVTGKPNASDLREGKRTLLVTRALERATPADARILREGLGRREMSDAEAEALREILRRSGAAESARTEARQLCDAAIAALEKTPLPPGIAASLRELARYSIERAF